MTADGSDEEVFLVPIGDDAVLTIPVAAQEDSSAEIDVSTLIEAVGTLIGAVLKHGGRSGARLYELSPDSQRQLRGAHRDEVGSYFRGILRDADGRIAHQIQLREVHAARAPAGFDALAAAQMAAIQAQLSRIEDTLGDIAASVTDVVGFLELQQRSRVETALQILRELHDRARQTGAITQTDWDRLTGVEFELESQLKAVSNELARLLGGRTFGKSPKSDADQMKAIKPERVHDLVGAHRMLIGGLRGWNELLLLRKYEAGELSEAEVAAAKDRLAKLEGQHQELLEQLKAVTEASKMTNSRGWLDRLRTDGLVIGGNNDQRHMRTVKSGWAKLTAVAEAAKTTPPPAAERRLLTAPSESADGASTF
jgi:hypothetical protein